MQRQSEIDTNAVEREAIILDTAWGMIDRMVNWEMFVKFEQTESSYLLFQNRGQARLFVILLCDFLSIIQARSGSPIPLGLEPVPSNARPSDLTFLFHLRQVCAKPALGADVAELSLTIENFSCWLEQEITVSNVYFGSIDITADLHIPRYRYLKMCGDIAKHNLARLAANAGHLRKILEQSGHAVTEQQSYMALEDFFERFHDDVFINNSSAIAESLNNIRWAIFEYLRPEFQRSWYPKEFNISGLQGYGYKVPTEITQPVATAMYWNVMNRVRQKPWFQRFVISDVANMRY